MSKLTYGEMRTRAEKISDEMIKDGVLAGLAVLQERHGTGWVDMIDCKTLNLADESACVLGQIYGNYSVGADELSEDDDDGRYCWAVAHAFEAEDGWYGEHSYPALTEAWKSVLCDGGSS